MRLGVRRNDEWKQTTEGGKRRGGGKKTGGGERGQKLGGEKEREREDKRGRRGEEKWEREGTQRPSPWGREMQRKTEGGSPRVRRAARSHAAPWDLDNAARLYTYDAHAIGSPSHVTRVAEARHLAAQVRH